MSSSEDFGDLASSSEGEQEEEELEEVEMLSITDSEEEDVKKKPKTGGKGGPADSDSDSDSSSEESEEESSSDGDDAPIKWADVDEFELDVQVSELCQAYQPAVVEDDEGGKRLSMMPASRSSDDLRAEALEDPLQLGTIDLTRRTLIREGSPRAAPVARKEAVARRQKRLQRRRTLAAAAAAAQELPIPPDNEGGGPGGLPLDGEGAAEEDVLLPSCDKFDARLYLANVHHHTSYEALVSGSSRLQDGLLERTGQLRSLVKDNFDRFISCKNTIDDIKVRLQETEVNTDISGTLAVMDSIRDVQVSANVVFQPMYDRQAQAEEIRSVLGLLRRFHSLFHLPSSLRDNIRLGKYEKVLREYNKSKGLIKSIQAPILMKVLEQAEFVIEDFSRGLFRTLAKPDLRQEEAERTIRQLLELEGKTDPVKFCLESQEQHMWRKLDACELWQKEQMTDLHRRRQTSVLADLRWKQLNQKLHNRVSMAALLGGLDASREGRIGPDSLAHDEEVARLQSELVARLTKVLEARLPGFCQLTHAVLAGRYFRGTEASVGSAVASQGKAPLASSAISSAAAEMKGPQEQKDRELLEMIMGIISFYQNKVRAALRALQASDHGRDYLLASQKTISQACFYLQKEASIPKRAVDALHGLRSESAACLVRQQCRHVLDTAAQLHLSEDWIPCSVDPVRGQTPYRILSVATRFEDIVGGAMQSMESVMLACNLTGPAAELVAADSHGGSSRGGEARETLAGSGREGEEGEGDVQARTRSEVAGVIQESFYKFFHALAGEMEAMSVSLSQWQADAEGAGAAGGGDAAAGQEGENGESDGRQDGGARSVRKSSLLSVIKASGISNSTVDAVLGNRSANGGGDGGSSPRAAVASTSVRAAAVNEPPPPPPPSTSLRGLIAAALASSSASPSVATLPVGAAGQLLLLLGSCAYCRTVALTGLKARWAHLWTEVTSRKEEAKLQAAAQKALQSLEQRLLDTFMEKKNAMLTAASHAYLSDNGIDWAAMPRPTGVRDVMLELVQDIVEVHAEVYLGAQLFSNLVMRRVLSSLLQTLRDGLARVPAILEYGYCQLSLEVDYLEAAMESCRDDSTISLFSSVRETLLEKATASVVKAATNSRAVGSASRLSSSAAAAGTSAANAGSPALVAKKLQEAATTLSVEVLHRELERTQVNTSCFTPTLEAQVSMLG